MVNYSLFLVVLFMSPSCSKKRKINYKSNKNKPFSMDSLLKEESLPANRRQCGKKEKRLYNARRNILGVYRRCSFSSQDVTILSDLLKIVVDSEKRNNKRISQKGVEDMLHSVEAVFKNHSETDAKPFSKYLELFAICNDEARIARKSFIHTFKSFLKVPIEKIEESVLIETGKQFFKQGLFLNPNGVTQFNLSCEAAVKYAEKHCIDNNVENDSLKALFLEAAATLASTYLPNRTWQYRSHFSFVNKLSPDELQKSTEVTKKISELEKSGYQSLASDMLELSIKEDGAELINEMQEVASSCCDFKETRAAMHLILASIRNGTKKNNTSSSTSQLQMLAKNLSEETPLRTLVKIAEVCADLPTGSLEEDFFQRKFIIEIISMNPQLLPKLINVIKDSIDNADFLEELDEFLISDGECDYKKLKSLLIYEGTRNASGNLEHLYRIQELTGFSGQARRDFFISNIRGLWNSNEAKRNLIIEKSTKLSSLEFKDFIYKLKNSQSNLELTYGVLSGDKDLAKDFSYRTYRDAFPFNPESVEEKKAFAETVEVMSFGHDTFFGFSSLTFEARRLGSDSSMLQRFVSECFEEYSFIHSELDLFPGPGIIASGMNISSIYGQDRYAVLSKQDPYERFKNEIVPWAKKEFDYLDRTNFYFARGFMAVSSPECPEHNIAGTHYSLIIFNDHFKNEESEVSYLVPTDKLEAFREMLAVNPENNCREGKMLSNVFSNPKDLLRFLCPDASKLINLGWGSNLGGSLCNAFAPCSEPYFGWERDLVGYHAKDTFGHVHKSHILGQYIPSMRDSSYVDMYEAWQPLREAHNEVYTTTMSLMNLFDLNRLALSFYHKGLTVSGEEGDTAVLEDSDVDDDIVPELSFQSFRMLKEAYSWHSYFRSKNAEKKDYPVLRVVPLFSYTTRAEEELALDTFDLTLKIDNTTHQLPKNSDGNGSLEQHIWGEMIIPRFSVNTSEDFRFLDRRYLL